MPEIDESHSDTANNSFATIVDDCEINKVPLIPNTVEEVVDEIFNNAFENIISNRYVQKSMSYSRILTIILIINCDVFDNTIFKFFYSEKQVEVEELSTYQIPLYKEKDIGYEEEGNDLQELISKGNRFIYF